MWSAVWEQAQSSSELQSGASVEGISWLVAQRLTKLRTSFKKPISAYQLSHSPSVHTTLWITVHKLYNWALYCCKWTYTAVDPLLWTFFCGSFTVNLSTVNLLLWILYCEPFYCEPTSVGSCCAVYILLLWNSPSSVGSCCAVHSCLDCAGSILEPFDHDP